MKYKANLDAIKKVIEIVGSNTLLSTKANISYTTILDWKSGRKAPSAESCIKLEKITEGKINRRNILPDYPWD